MPLDHILLVRHAPTIYNTRGIVQGQLDTPLIRGHGRLIDRLTDLIVREEGDILQQRLPIHIAASGLVRGYATAERILHRLVNKHPHQAQLYRTNFLTERGQGILEGLSFEEALRHLAPNRNLSADAETVYGFLYGSNDVPGGEPHEAVRQRLEQFVSGYIQQLDGFGILVTHSVSGNNLKNILIDGGMLAQPYQYNSPLSVVRLSRDPNIFVRYIEIGQYGPPNPIANGFRSHAGSRS